MIPSPTINVLAVPAGRGKTHKCAVPRMLREKGTKFLYVAPLLKILDEVEEHILEKLPGSRFSQVTAFSRIDSRRPTGEPISERLERKLGANIGSLDFAARIVGVTHASLWHLTPEMVRDRVVIVDEMPAFLEFLITGRDKTWQRLLAVPALVTEVDGIVSLTPAGQAELNQRAEGGVEKAIRKTLATIARAPAQRVSPKSLLQMIPSDALAAAREMVVMAAVPDAGYFPEWCHLNGFRRQRLVPEEHGLDGSPHRCVNAEIYYAFDTGRFTSKTKVTGEWGGVLGRLVKDSKASGGSLLHPAETRYLAAVNLGAGAIRQHLGAKNVLSPVVRGLNEYRDRNVMLWLAALQPDPHEIEIVRRLCPIRTAHEIIRSRHIEAAYQFVMRGELRDSNLAHVKILVPTRGDAEAMAKLLGTLKISQCSHMPARYRASA